MSYIYCRTGPQQQGSEGGNVPVIVSYGSGRSRQITGSLSRVMRQESKKMKPEGQRKRYSRMNRCVRHARKKYGAENHQTAEKQSARSVSTGTRIGAGPGPDVAVGSCTGRIAYREPDHASGDDG